MKYTKFEEWMVGKPITYGSCRGKVVGGCRDGDSIVYVLWELGVEAHPVLIEELDFLEEPQIKQVEVIWQVDHEVWCAVYGKGVVEAVLEKRNELEDVLMVKFICMILKVAYSGQKCVHYSSQSLL